MAENYTEPVEVSKPPYYNNKKMKEYKVVNWKMGLSKNNERLEDTLNQYAKMGWTLKHAAENSARLIFERDKNR